MKKFRTGLRTKGLEKSTDPEKWENIRIPKNCYPNEYVLVSRKLEESFGKLQAFFNFNQPSTIFHSIWLFFSHISIPNVVDFVLLTRMLMAHFHSLLVRCAKTNEFPYLLGKFSSKYPSCQWIFRKDGIDGLACSDGIYQFQCAHNCFECSPISFVALNYNK